MAQLVQEVSSQTVPRASLRDTLAIALKRHPLMLLRFAQTYGDRLHIRAPGVSIFFLFHPDDIREGYCGACHDWTGEPRTGGTRG